MILHGFMSNVLNRENRVNSTHSFIALSGVHSSRKQCPIYILGGPETRHQGLSCTNGSKGEGAHYSLVAYRGVSVFSVVHGFKITKALMSCVPSTR